MPVCNIPLIEYTMELLATVDIFEVFIVCTTHIDAIKAYFEYVLVHTPYTQAADSSLAYYY